MSLEIIILVLAVVVGVSLFFFLKSRPQKQIPSKEVSPKEEPTSIQPTPAPKVEVVEKKVLGPTWQERLSKGLARTRTEIFSKMENLIGGSKLTLDQIDEMEEILYTADMGPATVGDLITALKKEVKDRDLDQESLKKFLYNFLKEKMIGVQTKVDNTLYQFKSSGEKTKVIMVVGVNGAGKTTTIGKLATKLKSQGASVYVGACDTFRAAAVDQLQVWCERSGATMIRAKDGSDPSGVAFEALSQAVAAKADYCILDTAGRLHTKTNLMDELAKTKRVLAKVDPSAPDSVLLVIDSITGQNAIKQAEEFNKALGLTGLVFTKCDGSAKAGNAISIVNSLQVPIVYIGVGEQVEDLEIFNLDDYLGTLLGLQNS
jgi:fused signal recognition particle receptor